MTSVEAIRLLNTVESWVFSETGFPKGEHWEVPDYRKPWIYQAYLGQRPTICAMCNQDASDQPIRYGGGIGFIRWTDHLCQACREEWSKNKKEFPPLPPPIELLEPYPVRLWLQRRMTWTDTKRYKRSWDIITEEPQQFLWLIGQTVRTPFMPGGLVKVLSVNSELYFGNVTVQVEYLEDHPHGYKAGDRRGYIAKELILVEETEYERNHQP